LVEYKFEKGKQRVNDGSAQWWYSQMLALSGAAKNPKKDRTHKPKNPTVLSIVHTSQLLGLSTLFLVFTIDQIIRISAGIRFLCIRLASGFLYEFVTMGKLNVDGSSVSTSRFFLAPGFRIMYLIFGYLENQWSKTCPKVQKSHDRGQRRIYNI